MKIQFYLRFSTKLGQSIAVLGNTTALGNNDVEKAVPLKYLNTEYWEGAIDVNPGEEVKIRYKYVLTDENGNGIAEWDNDKQIDISKSGIDEIRIFDSWCSASTYENVFYTAPFQHVLLNERTNYKIKSPKSFTHIFKIKAPLLKKNEVVCLLGSCPAMQNWNINQPLMLTPENGWWITKIKLSNEELPVYYKYGIYNVKEKVFIQFESGDNRFLSGDVQDKVLTVLQDGFIRLPNDTWKGAGVSIPVFSLKSKNSFGVGEFPDLKLLVDWAKKQALNSFRFYRSTILPPHKHQLIRIPMHPFQLLLYIPYTLISKQ